MLKPKETESFPTPWNQLEAGILFGLGIPLLIFRDAGITGGVFDVGVTDVFIHPTPLISNNPDGTDPYCMSADIFESMYEPDD